MSRLWGITLLPTSPTYGPALWWAAQIRHTLVLEDFPPSVRLAGEALAGALERQAASDARPPPTDPPGRGMPRVD